MEGGGLNIKISLADMKISAEINYESTLEFCRDYLAEFDAPDVHVSVLFDDILAEREKYRCDCKKNGLAERKLSPNYFETLALYRKICDALIPHGVILFHGSALAIDGECFIFTAKSGVGKSTHARLYRELFGERVEMVNDDKPLIRLDGNEAYAYGTPWNGKHRLSSNIRRPISAICLISRAEENSICEVSKKDAIAEVFSQTHRPRDGELLEKTVALVDSLCDKVRLYRLECNTEPDAARISYEAMRREK